jgi:hypothetical protein
LKVTEVSGCHCVPFFQGACPDQQIVEWDIQARSITTLESRITSNLEGAMARRGCESFLNILHEASSSVAADPRASASAMHPESNRPLGRGERMTAIGR